MGFGDGGNYSSGCVAESALPAYRLASNEYEPLREFRVGFTDLAKHGGGTDTGPREVLTCIETR